MSAREQARRESGRVTGELFNSTGLVKRAAEAGADAASDVWEPLVRYALEAIVAYTGSTDFSHPEQCSPEQLRLLKAAFDLRHHLSEEALRDGSAETTLSHVEESELSYTNLGSCCIGDLQGGDLMATHYLIIEVRDDHADAWHSLKTGNLRKAIHKYCEEHNINAADTIIREDRTHLPFSSEHMPYKEAKRLFEKAMTIHWRMKTGRLLPGDEELAKRVGPLMGQK